MSARVPLDIQNQAAGQAALMLMESLLLELAGKRILSMEEISEMIQTVIDSKRQLIADGDEKEVAEYALGLLATLHNSVLASRAATGPDASSGAG